ncbi:MAG: type II toxin-antitoxin system antitoxin SocA domain-containing protein [Acidimicrobiia bacterium]
MATVRDTAAAIIIAVGPVDQWKLQKLLYYAQAWSQAWRDEPLFQEPVEAWRWGPVVEVVYQDYKAFGKEPFAEPVSGNRKALTGDECATLSGVLNRYGKLSGKDLAALTHEDEAWQEAWGRRQGLFRGRRPIGLPKMARSVRRSPFGQNRQESLVDLDETLVAKAAEGDGAALHELFRRP